MNFTSLIAVDPGASGAAVIRNDSPDGPDVVVRNYTGDESILGVVAFGSFGPKIFVIEQVHASPIMNPAAAFSFGDNFGGWRLAAKQAGLTVYGVTPQRWQAEIARSDAQVRQHLEDLNLEPDQTRRAKLRKKVWKLYAARMFPSIRVTDANADALCISEFALMQLRVGKEPGTLL